MYLNQAKNNTKIYMLAIICALTVLPTFADNQFTEKDIQKSVISMEMDDLSDEYLSQVEKLLYEQMHSQNYDSAINTIDYFINTSKQYYGENNSLTGFSYIAKERYYNGLMIPNMAKENLDKAYEIYLINKDNPDLRSNVLYDYVNYYSSIEEPYEAIKYLNQAVESKEKTAGTYLAYGQIYLNMKNYKEAEKFFAKYYDKIPKDSYADLFTYHISMANLYQNEHKFELFAGEINKAEDILREKINNNISATIQLNIIKVQYYIDTLNFDKALSVLNENEELISKYGKKYQKNNLIQQYIDCYKDKKDLANFTKYAKKINKFYDSIPSESLLSLTLYEKQIDIYKSLNKTNEASEYANIAINKIEPVKDFVPYLYGKFLRKAAEVKIQEGKTKEAKEYLDIATESYKKSAPETAYEFYEIYKLYAEIFNQDGNSSEAINYYNKAINILKPLIGEKGNDLADIYFNLANIYIDNNKIEEAILIADEAYDIKESCYGKTHVKTLEGELNKYYIYMAAGLNDKASNIISEINLIVDNDKALGYKPEFFHRLDIENGNISLQNKEYNEAIIYANKALQSAEDKNQKIEVYNLLYKIYNDSGNKFKAYKYKKLGNIE